MTSRILPRVQQISRKTVAEWRQLTAAALIGVTLAACSTTGGLTKDSPDEAKVAAAKARAEARWKAIIGGDVETSYGMLSAGSKATTSIDSYRRKARLKGFTEASVKSATCAGEVCKVAVEVVLDVPKMKGLRTAETETWILEKGQYWYVFPF
ncbi:MAG: hypothetical protein JSR18_14310 [Proteobacteria bacterium]|nr:hypothetical protein [Pseudomonadota bacterium]